MANCVKRILLPAFLSIGASYLFAVPIIALGQSGDDDDDEDSQGSHRELTLTLEGERRSLLPDDDPITNVEQEVSAGLELSLIHNFNDSWRLRTDTLFEAEQVREAQSVDASTRSRLSLEQLALDWSPQLTEGLLISAGRQDVAEARGWWWDASLDAVSLSGGTERLRFHSVIGTSAHDISTDNDPIDPEDEQILYVLSSLETRWSHGLRLGLFMVHVNDHSPPTRLDQPTLESDFDESDARLTWLGWRLGWTSRQYRAGSFDWQLDAGLLRGNDDVSVSVDDDDDEDDEEGDGDAAILRNGNTHALDNSSSATNTTLQIDRIDKVAIQAWALDTNVDWLIPLPLTPTLGIRYARGSGTRADRTDGSRSYRQSGLHENADHFAWYGELFNPELSNIEIVATRLTIRPGSTWVVSVAHHLYRRLHADSEIGDTGIEADPEGEGRNLGSETGLYAHAEIQDDWQFTASVSRFKPGNAYETLQDDSSLKIRVDIEYDF